MKRKDSATIVQHSPRLSRTAEDKPGSIIVELTEINSSEPLRKVFSSTQGMIQLGRGGRGSAESKQVSSGLFRSKNESTRVMSKQHAQLHFDKDPDSHEDRAFILDSKSTNGTYQNKKLLIPHVQYLVCPASLSHCFHAHTTLYSSGMVIQSVLANESPLRVISSPHRTFPFRS